MTRIMLIALSLAAAAIFVTRCCVLHQVDPVVMDALVVGASEDEVESKLGKPTSIVTNDSLWTSWHYRQHWGIYCEVVLSFDNREKYRGRFHDH